MQLSIQERVIFGGVLAYLLIQEEVPEWSGKMYLRWLYSTSDEKKIERILDLNSKENWLPEPSDRQSLGHLVWQMLRSNPKHRIDSDECFQKAVEIFAREGLDRVLR